MFRTPYSKKTKKKENRVTDEASRGAGAQMCDCKRDWSWVRSPFLKINYLFKFIFSFLRCGVGQAWDWVPPLNMRMQCLQTSTENGNGVFYTRFPLPNLLCAETAWSWYISLLVTYLFHMQNIREHKHAYLNFKLNFPRSFHRNNSY